MTDTRFRPITPSRSSRGGGSARTEQSVKDIQNNAFLQHFYKTLESAGGKFTDDEIMKFLGATNATPDQVGLLMKMKDVINLDKIVQLQKIDDNPGPNFGGVIYKHVWEYTAADAAEGWMRDKADLEFQRQLAGDKATIEKETALGELEKIIIALPRISDDPDANVMPNNREEYNKLAISLGLKTPSEFAVLEKHFGDLLKSEDKKTWVNVVGGKSQYYRFTEYEAKKYNKDHPTNKVVLGGSAGGIASTQNSERIGEVINRIVKAGNTQSGPPGTPAPSFFKIWGDVQAAIGNDPSIAVGGEGNNWKDIQGRAKAAYAGDEKKEAEISTQVMKTGQAIEDLSGKPYAAVSKWLADNKITDPTVRSAFIQDWEKLNPLVKYTGPRMLFTDEGGKSSEIGSWSEYALLINEYPHSEYKEVPYPPTMKIDYNAINQGEDTFLAQGWETRSKKVGNKMVKERVWVSEPRWSKDGASRRMKLLKGDMKESLQSLDLVRGNASKILTALAKKTGTMDGFTFKWIEKMLDPTGVVRQSDVEFMEGFGDQLERARTYIKRFKGLWSESGDGASVMISDELRKDFADAIITVFNEIHKSNVQQLQWIKGDFDHLQEKHPTQYGGRLDWADVINPNRYAAYLDYEEEENRLYNEFLMKTSGSGQSNTPTGSSGRAQFGTGKLND